MQGRGFGLQLGRRRAVQPVPLVLWLPGAAQGGPGDLSSRSLTRFPPGADLGPVVTLLYVTNVSPACLPIWLCILKC